MLDEEVRTPPAQLDETPPTEELDECREDSRPLTPVEEKEMPPESAPVIEEPKEPVDPAVRAKQNWLRLYNKVLDQLREFYVIAFVTLTCTLLDHHWSMLTGSRRDFQLTLVW